MIEHSSNPVIFSFIQTSAMFTTFLSWMGYVHPILGLIAGLFAVGYGWYHFKLARQKWLDYKNGEKNEKFDRLDH